MMACVKERREKCKGLPWKKCQEQKLVSEKCMNAFGMLDGILLNLKAAKCTDIAKICPIDINKFKGEERKKSTEEMAECLRKNKDLIPQSCKEFMDFMNNPAITEEYTNKLKTIPGN